jgi:predicted NBD/HSP70 family sugar kinase
VTTAERDAPRIGSARLTCVEVGASTLETIVLDGDELVHRTPLAYAPAGQPLLIAVPGLVRGKRVVAASNLGWYDVDPALMLGLDRPADLVCNDAEAAALGESVLRPGQPDLVFVGIGTGIGGAVVIRGAAEANLFAHGGDFSDRLCACGHEGCLETVAAGWALPSELTDGDLAVMAHAIAVAIRQEPHATPELVVVAGGLTRRHPSLVSLLSVALPERRVCGTAVPESKSAAAWGLRHLYSQHAHAVTHF